MSSPTRAISLHSNVCAASSRAMPFAMFARAVAPSNPAKVRWSELAGLLTNSRQAIAAAATATKRDIRKAGVEKAIKPYSEVVVTIRTYQHAGENLVRA